MFSSNCSGLQSTYPRLGNDVVLRVYRAQKALLKDFFSSSSEISLKMINFEYEIIVK